MERKRYRDLLDQNKELNAKIAKVENEKKEHDNWRLSQMKEQAKTWGEKVDQREKIISEVRSQLEVLKTELKSVTAKYDELNFRLMNDSQLFKDSDVKKENEFLVHRLAELGPEIMQAAAFKQKESYYKQ